MSNKGVRIKAYLYPLTGTHAANGQFWLPLNYTDGNHDGPLTTPLTRIGRSFQFLRRNARLHHHLANGSRKLQDVSPNIDTIYVKQEPRFATTTRGPNYFTFRCGNLPEHGLGNPGTVIIGALHDEMRNTADVSNTQTTIQCSDLDMSFTFIADGSAELEFILALFVNSGSPQIMITVPGKGTSSAA